MLRIAINGFGRIGRAAFKIAFDRPDIEIVAINDPHDHSIMAYLLKYDTVYGHYHHAVEVHDDRLVVDGKEIKVFADRDPGNLPWKDLDIDVVIESTGVFRTKETAEVHVTKAGARAVVISSPAKDDVTPTYVQGINDTELAGHTVISNASCTTNCISPVMQILHETFGVEKSLLTTIHSYTNGQSLVDEINKDPRRGRAAAENLIPTSTGAAKATCKAIPDLAGKFDGMAVRVPTPVVSLSDITALLKQKVTIDDVNNAFIQAAQSDRYNNIFSVTDEPLVSSDFIGSTYSAIVDLSLTNVVGDDLIKVIAWYDNEWGYSHRLIDMVEDLGKTL